MYYILIQKERKLFSSRLNSYQHSVHMLQFVGWPIQIAWQDIKNIVVMLFDLFLMDFQYQHGKAIKVEHAASSVILRYLSYVIIYPEEGQLYSGTWMNVKGERGTSGIKMWTKYITRAADWRKRSLLLQSEMRLQ